MTPSHIRRPVVLLWATWSGAFAVRSQAPVKGAQVQASGASPPHVPQWKSVESLTCESELGPQEAPVPTSIVVFDLDETLTATTLMPPGLESELWPEAAEQSFSSPWVKDRLQQLRGLLKDLKAEPGRALAVLTRNNNGNGAEGILKLLQAAWLAEYFDAIWSLGRSPQFAYRLINPASDGQGNCEPATPPCLQIANSDQCEHHHNSRESCVNVKGRFSFLSMRRSCCKFVRPQEWLVKRELPIEVGTSKATVLKKVVHDVKAWFPQLVMSPSPLTLPSDLSLASIVLVDDDAKNFEDNFNVKLPRRCEVPRYVDDDTPGRFAGGIGAYGHQDFQKLLGFVRHQPEAAARAGQPAGQDDEARPPQ